MRTAYILLWFPAPTETFIFREVVNLQRFGLPLNVYTLYGEQAGGLSSEMKSTECRIERLGLRALPQLLRGVAYWWRRKPETVREIVRAIRLLRWRHLEKSAESLWALFASFEIARRIEADGIEHIHAPWASGCATAAWAASKLTGRPFSFTARAWDIYPPDGLIRLKIEDAALIRTETAANVRHLSAYADAPESRFHVTYNGAPLTACREAAVTMQPPYRFLAVGRFVRKKGFVHLLRAARILLDRGVEFHLTIAGDGILRWHMKWLTRRLGLSAHVRFPGFVPHDAIADLFAESDIFILPCVIAPSNDRDGLPTVILEALLHRLPVITTAISGIPELIEDGRTGLLVRESDPAAIAQAVMRLIENRAEALFLAEAGRARVHQQFDAETNHRRLLELYKTIASPA